MDIGLAFIAVGALLFSGAACAADRALHLDLSGRTRVVFQPKPEVAPGDAARTHTQPQAALGLEIPSPPQNQGTRGLLRVQLSGNSVLNFRPRHHGLQVTYKSSF